MSNRKPSTNTTSAAGSAAKPAVRVRGPADLVHLIPFLLGFHPVESLVLLGLRRGSVVVTVRVDLADLVAPVGPDCAAAAGPQVLTDTVAAMAHGGAQDLLAVVFDDRAGALSGRRADEPLPWHGLLPAVLDAAHGCRLGLSEMLLVSQKRWWSLTCTDTGCCPADGLPLEPESSAVPAAAAFAGLVALPDRDAMAALLEPKPDSELAAALATAAADPANADEVRRAHRSVTRSLFAAARLADRRGPGPALSDEDAVRFGAALSRIPIRDSVWLAIDDGRLDGRELWRALGRRLPGTYAAAPMFLYGWASWRAGNGALAHIAADHALAADPDYTAADLLVGALSRGIDPRRVPKLRQRSA